MDESLSVTGVPWPPRIPQVTLPPAEPSDSDANDSDTTPEPETQLNEVFARLKWSVLDPASEAQILQRDDQGEPKWTTFFTNTNILVADEPVTLPPQSCLHIKIQPMYSWWLDFQKDHECQKGCKCKGPEMLVIENKDGGSISVRQFIEAIHDYLLPLRNIVHKAHDISWGWDDDWEKARFYYDDLCGALCEDGDGPDTELMVHLQEEEGEEGDQLEDHWSELEARYGMESASS